MIYKRGHMISQVVAHHPPGVTDPLIADDNRRQDIAFGRYRRSPYQYIAPIIRRTLGDGLPA
jgi:hypothetical protein